MTTRRLSEIRLIYDGCAGFGPILRSFSFNRPHYSPHTIEQSDSTRHNLVTITHLGQPPSRLLPLARQSFSGEREGGYNSLVEMEVEAYYPLALGYSLFHVFGVTILRRIQYEVAKVTHYHSHGDVSRGLRS